MIMAYDYLILVGMAAGYLALSLAATLAVFYLLIVTESRYANARDYCPHCGGTGFGAFWAPCQHCGMTGYVLKEHHHK